MEQSNIEKRKLKWILHSDTIGLSDPENNLFSRIIKMPPASNPDPKGILPSQCTKFEWNWSNLYVEHTHKNIYKAIDVKI